MKKIGIIYAMKEEMVAFKKYFDVCKEQDIYNLHFYEGTIHGNYCILVTSGVGKVNAARTTQVLIDNYKVDYVINVGVSGGICDNLYIGDIIVGERLVQHDFNIMAFNHERGYIPDIGVYIGANEYLVNLSDFNFSAIFLWNSVKSLEFISLTFLSFTCNNFKIAFNFSFSL